MGQRPAHDSPVPFSLLPLWFFVAHSGLRTKARRAEVVCDDPRLTLTPLPDVMCHALPPCAGLIQMGHVRQRAEPPWAPEWHTEESRLPTGNRVWTSQKQEMINLDHM